MQDSKIALKLVVIVPLRAIYKPALNGDMCKDSTETSSDSPSESYL